MLLREICYRHVPKEIVDRPVGFAIPLESCARPALRMGESRWTNKSSKKTVFQSGPSSSRLEPLLDGDGKLNTSGACYKPRPGWSAGRDLAGRKIIYLVSEDGIFVRIGSRWVSPRKKPERMSSLQHKSTSTARR